MEQDTRLIQVGQGRVAIVDSADYQWLSSFKWYLWRSRDSKSEYAIANTPHGKKRMHRLIAGDAPQSEVDHRNGNGLDNRRNNLRVCHKNQNQWNRTRTWGSSRYLGVYRRSAALWRAEIAKHGRRFFLGTYPSEEHAARARDSAALLLHGDFASFNFPHSVIKLSIREIRDNARKAMKQHQAALPTRARGGFFGVYDGRYQFVARIYAKRRTHYLGHWDTSEEAATAADAGAKYFTGRVPRLNFPDRNIPPRSPKELRALARQRRQDAKTEAA